MQCRRQTRDELGRCRDGSRAAGGRTDATDEGASDNHAVCQTTHRSRVLWCGDSKADTDWSRGHTLDAAHEQRQVARQLGTLAGYAVVDTQ